VISGINRLYQKLPEEARTRLWPARDSGAA